MEASLLQSVFGNSVEKPHCVTARPQTIIFFTEIHGQIFLLLRKAKIFPAGLNRTVFDKAR